MRTKYHLTLSIKNKRIKLIFMYLIRIKQIQFLTSFLNLFLKISYRKTSNVK